MYKRQIIASKEDADNVATMIEEVGKDVAKSIKDTPANKFIQAGPIIAYQALQNSLKDEVDKTDIWFPIFQKFAEAHGNKLPGNLNLDDSARTSIKNASPDRINRARDMIKKTIDDDFGIRAGESRSRAPPLQVESVRDGFEQKLGAPPGTRGDIVANFDHSAAAQEARAKEKRLRG